MYWFLINDRILIAEVKHIMLFINMRKLTINIRKVMITMKTPPNRQILVPRTSRECSTPTPPKDLIWASRKIPRCPLDELENTFLGQCGLICWMSLNFILIFFGNLLDWPNQSKSNSILTVYLEPTRTSKMKLFLLNQLMAFSR